MGESQKEMTRKHVKKKKKSMRKSVSSKKTSVWNSQKPQSYPLNKKVRTLLKTKLMLNKRTTKELRKNQESNMAAKKLEAAPVELVLEFTVVTKAKEGIKLNE